MYPMSFDAHLSFDRAVVAVDDAGLDVLRGRWPG